MADFKTAFALTIGHEQGHAHNPKDVGAETYNGISRRYHGTWAGWTFIDAAKRGDNFPHNIPHSKLASLVEDFYFNKFWRPIKGDQIADQMLAEWVFDVAVNGSVRRAGRFLQVALNGLNRAQRDYPDLIVDGVIGNKTIEAITAFTARRDINVLLLYFGCQMVTHWLSRATEIESQEEFLNGIGNRWVANVKRVADQHYLA